MATEGPKFTIFLDYTTGDSFNTNKITDEEIGFVWTDYYKALEAAHLIKNHNDLLERYEGHYCNSAKDRKSAWNEALESEWYANYKRLHPDHKITNDYDLFQSFAVKNDDGDPVIISPFWYGYFETINGIRVGIISDIIL